jgi:hypothetical protein
MKRALLVVAFSVAAPALAAPPQTTWQVQKFGAGSLAREKPGIAGGRSATVQPFGTGKIVRWSNGDVTTTRRHGTGVIVTTRQKAN